MIGIKMIEDWRLIDLIVLFIDMRMREFKPLKSVINRIISVGDRPSGK